MFKKKSTREMVQGGTSKAPKPPRKPLFQKKSKAPAEPEEDLRTDELSQTAEPEVPKERVPLFRSSKIFVAAVSLLLAAVIALVLLPKLYGKQSAITEAVRVKANVTAGETITKEMLSVDQVGAYGLSGKVLHSTEDAVGMIAADALYAGDLLSTDHLISPDDYAAVTSEAEEKQPIAVGHCLVTVELPNTASGVAGVLRAGDMVDVYEIKSEPDEETGEELTSVIKRLPKMCVYDVLNSDLVSLSQLDELNTDAATASGGQINYRPVYVVFDCTETEAKVLIQLQNDKTMHMARTNSGG